MHTQISPRELEALSAYLDKQLSATERTRIEARLKENADLQAALEELRRTRLVLRSQPRLRAPRNFTLTPEMVGMGAQANRRPAARSYGSPFTVLRLVSALASLLFVLVLIGDFFSNSPASPGPNSVLMSAQETQQEAYPAAAVPFAASAGSQAANGAATEATPETSSMLAKSQPPTDASLPSAAVAAAGIGEEATPTPTFGGHLAASLAPQGTPAGSEAAAATLGLGAGAPETPTPEAPPAAAVAPPAQPAPDQSITSQAEPTTEPAAGAALTNQAAPAVDTESRAGLLGNPATLRVVELVLAALAVLSGLAAFLLRRSAQ